MRVRVEIDDQAIELEYREEHQAVKFLEHFAYVMHRFGVERGFQRVAECCKKAGGSMTLIPRETK